MRDKNKEHRISLGDFQDMFFEEDANIAVHCNTRAKARMFCDWLHNEDCRWDDGDSYEKDLAWLGKDTWYTNKFQRGPREEFTAGCWDRYDFDEIDFDALTSADDGGRLVSEEELKRLLSASPVDFKTTICCSAIKEAKEFGVWLQTKCGHPEDFFDDALDDWFSEYSNDNHCFNPYSCSYGSVDCFGDDSDIIYFENISFNKNINIKTNEVTNKTSPTKKGAQKLMNTLKNVKDIEIAKIKDSVAVAARLKAGQSGDLIL